MSSQNLFWTRANSIPPLALGEIQVWAMELDLSPLPQDWSVLSHEEVARARRFIFSQDRDRYVRVHSAMRMLLGSLAGTPPAEILFSRNAYGKPAIRPDRNSQGIQFSLSHSAGIGVFTAARGYQVGIDLEIVRPIGKDIAEHNFSPGELATLESLSSEEWVLGFYRCWTSKEALLKGEGCGLNLALDSFDVEADPRRPPALLNSRPPASIAADWRLIEVNPATNAVATLAIRKETDHPESRDLAQAVRCFAFTG